VSDDSRRVAVLETALLLVPALTVYSVWTGQWHVALTACILCVFSMLLPWKVRVSDRSIIYSVVGAMVLAVLEDSAWPVTDSPFSFLASLLHPEWIIPVLVYAALFFTICCEPQPAIGAAIAAAVCILAFCGELRIFGQWFGVPQEIEARYGGERAKQWFYLVLAVTFFLSCRSLRRYGRVPGHASGRRLGVLLTVLLIAGSAYGIRYAANRYADELRNLENFLLHGNSVSHWRRPEQLFDRSSVNICFTLEDVFRKNESEIAFHVIGSQVPGYLRGRGFTTYEPGGKWSGVMDYDGFLPVRQAPGLVSDHTFELRSGSAGLGISWLVFPSVQNQGRIIYFPGRTVELQMLADKAYLGKDGTLTVTGGRPSAGYTLRADSNADSGGPLVGDPLKDPELRRVPGELGAVLQEVCYAAKITPRDPDAVVFQKLLNFFYGNFRYSLSPEPAEEDPVVHFLLRTRRGHCELFASAMTLALRMCRIPARYATGFICDEPHRSGRSFIARMGNAHAWVEAFDRDRREWILLDPTPAVPPLPGRKFEAVRQYWECAALCGQEFFALFRRGHVAEAVSALFGGIWALIERSWSSPWSLPFYLMLPAVLLWMMHRHFRRNSVLEAAPEKRKLIRQYHRLLCRMYWTGRIPWFSRPTAMELIRKLESAPLKEPAHRRIMIFLRSYCALRYRVSPGKWDGSRS